MILSLPFFMRQRSAKQRCPPWVMMDLFIYLYTQSFDMVATGSVLLWLAVIVGKNCLGRCAFSFNLRYCTSILPRDSIFSELLWSRMVEYLIQLFLSKGFGSVKIRDVSAPTDLKCLATKLPSSSGLTDLLPQILSVRKLFLDFSFLLCYSRSKSLMYRSTKFILLDMSGIYSLGDCMRDVLGDLECLFLGEVVGGYRERELVYNWGVAIVGLLYLL